MSDLSDSDDLIGRARRHLARVLAESMGPSFDDLRILADPLLEPQVVTSGDEEQVLVSFVVEGRDSGGFQGQSATGRFVQFDGVALLRPGGTDFEARVLVDEASLYRQLGHIIPTPRPVSLDSLGGAAPPEFRPLDAEPL